MSSRAPRRAAATTALTVATFALGALLAVLVAGSASAAGSKTTSKKTTTKTTSGAPLAPTTTGPDTPSAHFFVINGTVNAASDHEIVGSSAFPNFTSGAVDNYYALAHAHVDNSPSAEGTASPGDTGPIGQTAAAGNFQQPQYADARWPGDSGSGRATYGNQGGPYAVATAEEYHATADASEASNELSAPGPTGSLALPVPKGFDLELRKALAGWKEKWQGVAPKKPPAVTTPIATVPVPKVPVPRVPLPNPNAKVTTPSATVTTPVATVTTPAPVPTPPAPTTAGAPPALPVTVPTTSLPTPGAGGSSRSVQSAAKPADGATALSSSTLASLESTTNTLLTSGESSLGRVSIGGGQIVIEGIHVTASIANDGTPTYKAAVSVASATVGGIPVTIDQDGVHVAGQGTGLPSQQASDALNGALKQAGIQLFLVGPEVKTPCGQGGAGSGSGTTTTAGTTTAPNDQSSTTSSCGQSGASACDSSSGGGVGGGAGPALPSVGPTSGGQTDTTSAPGACDQTGTTSCGTESGSSGGTTTSAIPGIGPGTSTTRSTTTTKTTSTNKTDTTGTTDTTSTPTSCDETSTTPASGPCATTGKATGTTSTTPNKTDTAATGTSSVPTPFSPLGGGADSGASEETVTATGVHVVFTQPVNQSGVPAQFAEHILGEVFVDSLAVPAGNPPDLGFSSSSSSSSSFSPSTCGGSHSSKPGSASGASASGDSGSAAGGAVGGGGSTASGSGSLSGSPSGSTFGSSAQPGSGAGGNSLPAAIAAALRKPLWLLLAYLVWQALVVGTGASLWNWRREEAA